MFWCTSMLKMLQPRVWNSVRNCDGSLTKAGSPADIQHEENEDRSCLCRPWVIVRACDLHIHERTPRLSTAVLDSCNTCMRVLPVLEGSDAPPRHSAK
jgi:hypothetical protein